jgi:hypothetical protein
MCTKTLLELLPGNGVRSSMCGHVSIPSIRCCTFHTAWGIQNLLTIFLLMVLRQSSAIERIHWMWVSGWVVAHKLFRFAWRWRGCMRWRLVLVSLHILDNGSEILQELHLSCKELLHHWIHCWSWWWRKHLILLVGDVITYHRRNDLSSSWLVFTIWLLGKSISDKKLNW